RATTQARRFGTEFLLTQEVVNLDNKEGVIVITMSDGSQVSAHSLVIATGVAYRRLDVPGVEQLTGRGVYYGAAIAEASSISGEDVYIVGGANSAGQAAIYFANFARNVTMLVRGPALSATMSHYLIERIEQAPNIDVRYKTTVESVGGIDHVENLTLRNTETNKCDVVSANGLFVFIGAQPLTEWLDGVILRDEKGFLLTGLDITAAGKSNAWQLDRDPFLLETSVPGVFAAGDVRHGSGKRVATAVGEGAMAVMSIWQYRALMGL
ncbi:MAG TPA: NAD(P)/FAD-dependent oxidoreductase, partial [Thermomicrobiales bacterium]|nr:NAD(P)/FAD-dependent oxidoreductase [Thermomicrobiales bacterium]